MNLVVTLDICFDRTPDGKIWSLLRPYSFWDQYLTIFDSVKVIARVKDVNEPKPGWFQSNGERATFVPMPFFVGPIQYLLHSGKVKRVLEENVLPTDAVLTRAVNCFDSQLYPILKKRKQPFGVQVVVNPATAMSKGAYHSVFRPYLKYRLPKLLKALCQDASAVTYVTRQTLQSLYPPLEKAFSNYYSNVRITPDAMIDQSRRFSHFSEERPARIVTVGSLANLNKAFDILIKTVAHGLNQGLFLHLTIVGGGKEEGTLVELTKSLGIEPYVTFLGYLHNVADVRKQFDESDLFILPSRSEGMPRAMVEAMARALPCIGSNAGGIPELLPQEWIVPVNDIPALSNAIERMVTSPHLMNQSSKRNLEEAMKYHIDILSERQREFLLNLRNITVQWNEPR